MGVLQKPWWAKHGTVIFAIALSVGLAVAIRAFEFQASRAVFPLTVVWALAFHSIDNRRIMERMESAANDVRKATVEAQDTRG